MAACVDRRVVVAALIDDEGRTARVDLEAALRWLGEVSRGRFSAQVFRCEPVKAPRELSYYALQRGMGRAPRNSQSLAADVLAQLAPRAHTSDATSELAWTSVDQANFVLCAPAAFDAHTWRFPHGGTHLGGARWARRYAVLPDGAPLGTVAHELGHLLLGWPDFGARTQLGTRCLMALGGLNEAGREPAPPCAPLCAREGWREQVELDAGTPLSALGELRVGVFEHEQARWMLELRATVGGATLLVYRAPQRDPLDVRLDAVRDVSSADLGASALAFVVEQLRETAAGAKSVFEHGGLRR